MKGRNVWTWKKLHKMKIPRKNIARFFSSLDILFNARGSSPMSHEGSLMLSSPPRAMWTWTCNVNSSREILQITPKNFCAILIGVNSHCTHIIIIAQFYIMHAGLRAILQPSWHNTHGLWIYITTPKSTFWQNTKLFCSLCFNLLLLVHSLLLLFFRVFLSLLHKLTSVSICFSC